jgi:hypothetical protein
MGGRRTTSTDRLGIGIAIVLTAVVFFLIDRPRAGAATLLIGLVPYLAFLAPFHCREMTTRRTACTRTRWGWLIGCHDHRWYALRRIFGRQVPARAQMRPPASSVAMGSGPTTSSATNWTGHSRTYDTVSLAVAIVSAIAGVLALLPWFQGS